MKLSGEPQLGLRFEPRCLYVVITSNTRRDLFDELLEAKRIMSDPLNLTVRNRPPVRLAQPIKPAQPT